MNTTVKVILTSDAACDDCGEAPNHVAGDSDKHEVRRVYFMCMALLVIVATIFGNALVIVAVFTEKRLRKVSNSFIVSLAISDIVVGLFVTPVSLLYYLDQQWRFGAIFCDIWVSVDVVCCTASIVNLCVISFDRYNAITQPLKYAFKRTPRRAALMIGFVWTYSLLIAAPPLLGWRNERQDNECRVSQVIGYTFFSTIGAFYIPLVVMLVMYARIFRATLKRKQTWVPGPTCRVGNGVQRKTEITVLINATESVRKHHDRQNSDDLGVCSTSTLKVSSYYGDECNITRSEDSLPTDSGASSPYYSVSRSRSSSTANNNLLSVPRSTGPDGSEKTIVIRLSNTGDTKSTSFSCEITPASTDGSANSSCLSVNEKTSPGASGQESSGFESPIRRLTKMSKHSDIASSTNYYRKVLPLASHRRRRKRKNKISLSQEKTAARTLGIIIGGFVMCWLPFFLLALIGPLCSCSINVTITDVFTWFGYSNSALNPIIYTFFNPDFRKAFRNILTFVTCKK